MIEVRDLSKRFGAKIAVDHLSFTVHPGRVTGFLGPNGAGKSTTMRVILGLDAPTSGSVTIGGMSYRQLPFPMRAVGALLEAKAAHGGRTAYGHLLCLAYANGLPARRVQEVLALVGLTEVARKRVKGFSLGMSQRLGIAAALLGDPRVLLFDEPVNGLDPEGIRWIRNLMKMLAAQGRTVFVSSHLMSEMQNTADHLIVIGRGRLIADCSMAEFIGRFSGQTVVVRTPQPDAVSRLVAEAGGQVSDWRDGALVVRGLAANRISDLAYEHNVRLHEVATTQASLEEAYMALTAGTVEYRAGPAPPIAPTVGWKGAVGWPNPPAWQPVPGQPVPGQQVAGQPPYSPPYGQPPYGAPGTPAPSPMPPPPPPMAPMAPMAPPPGQQWPPPAPMRGPSKGPMTGPMAVPSPGPVSGPPTVAPQGPPTAAPQGSPIAAPQGSPAAAPQGPPAPPAHGPPTGPIGARPGASAEPVRDEPASAEDER